MCALVVLSSSRISLTTSVHALILQLGNTAYRDLHLAQGTHYHVPSRDLPSRTDTRLFGSIKVHFKDSKGNLLKTVEGNEGDSLLDIAHEYDIDLEGVYPCIHRCRSSWTVRLPVSSNLGACEGSVACSTCHVILTPECYDLLPEPEDDENDMLDMAFGLTDTSVAFVLLPIQFTRLSFI
jgi:ferredoxin